MRRKKTEKIFKDVDLVRILALQSAPHPPLTDDQMDEVVDQCFGSGLTASFRKMMRDKYRQRISQGGFSGWE